MNRLLKKTCSTQDTISCGTTLNTLNKNCCTYPTNEVKKTRHYTVMSKNYYTRLEDRLKAKRKNEKCNNFKKQYSYVFNNKSELQAAVDLWVTSRLTALCTYGEINKWNTSNITDMSFLFYEKFDFNDDISNWDTSNVVTFDGMFQNTNSFNQINIRKLVVGSNASLTNMFLNATAFSSMIANLTSTPAGWNTTPTYEFFNQ